MKILVLSLLIVFTSSFGVCAEENKYIVDDNQVDKIISQAQEIDYSQDLTLGNSSSGKAVEPVTAAVLSGFLGWIGVHRMYLGSSQPTIIGYVALGVISFTGMAFLHWSVVLLDAVLWIGDTVVLILGAMEEDVSKYTDNPKFFMW